MFSKNSVLLGIVLISFVALFFGCTMPDYLTTPKLPEIPKNITDLEQVTNFTMQYIPNISDYKTQDAGLKTTEEQSTLHTVKGTASSPAPYASIDKENYGVKKIGPSGGVVTVKLPKGGKAHVIIPPDEVIQQATVTVLPYTEMPSSQNHPALSDELGYGVYVHVSSVQMGVRGYVVFDFRHEAEYALMTASPSSGSGTTTVVYDRCNPELIWFNPMICAQINAVPGTKVVNKEYAIVTPIFLPKNDKIILTRNTIPTGVDDIVVTRFKGSDLYIPQKLDKALASNIARNTLKLNGNAKDVIEAGALAFDWNLVLTNQEVMSIANAVYSEDVETYFEMKKLVLVGQETSTATTSHALSATDEDEQEDLQRAGQDAQDGTTEIAEQVYDDAESYAKSGKDDSVVESAIAVENLAQAGVPGATESLGTVQNNLQGRIDNPGKGGTPIPVFEGMAMMGQEGINKNRENARKEVQRTIGDEHSTMAELMGALRLARLYGFAEEGDITNSIIDRIWVKLSNMLLQGGLCKDELLDIATLGHVLGFDEIANSALGQAFTAPDCNCDEPVKKTLETYGIQKCTK